MMMCVVCVTFLLRTFISSVRGQTLCMREHVCVCMCWIKVKLLYCTRVCVCVSALIDAQHSDFPLSFIYENYIIIFIWWAIKIYIKQTFVNIKSFRVDTRLLSLERETNSKASRSCARPCVPFFFNRSQLLLSKMNCKTGGGGCHCLRCARTACLSAMVILTLYALYNYTLENRALTW